jgi:hypothetical protein
VILMTWIRILRESSGQPPGDNSCNLFTGPAGNPAGENRGTHIASAGGRTHFFALAIVAKMPIDMVVYVRTSLMIAATSCKLELDGKSDLHCIYEEDGTRNAMYVRCVNCMCATDLSCTLCSGCMSAWQNSKICNSHVLLNWSGYLDPL